MNSEPSSRIARIAVASDLSEESDSAIKAGAALALAAGAELTVIHSVQPPVFPYWKGSVSEATRSEWEESARTDLHWQVRRVLGDEAPPLSLEVMLGEPAAEISRVAKERGAALLVLGPHRPRAAFDDLLGSTADRIIRICDLPCLIANRPITTPLRQVLFPVDFSPPSYHCVDRGIELLQGLEDPGAATDDSPTVVEVLFVSAFASTQPRAYAVEPKLGELVENARARIGEGSKLKLVPRILSAPLPVDGIRRVAESMDADLVVLGTHGHGTLGRMLIGSVASAVSRTIPHSVLLIPPP